MGLLRASEEVPSNVTAPPDTTNDYPLFIGGVATPRTGLARHAARDYHKRITENGSKTTAAEEALASLLSHVVAASEAKRFARRLMSTFGSLGATIACKGERLLETCDGDEGCVAILRDAHAFMKALLREPAEERPILNSVNTIFDYLSVSMAYEPNEQMRILYLNSKNALLMDEVHSEGTVNHVAVYPREVLKRVIEVGAGAIILVHNHPSGDPTPSQQDVEMTLLLARILRDIDVTLHDHVVVGRLRCASMLQLKLI